MIDENSKRISKSDDAAKDFIRVSLGDDVTRGFDVDSVYCEVSDQGVRWTLVEFLKCDSVAPEDSHPNRYWGGRTSNKRKFLSLWALCQSLRAEDAHARLLLVNYRDSSSKVKLLHVLDATDECIKTQDKVMLFEEWSVWFKGFNKNKKGSTWDVLERLKRRAPGRKE